MINTTIFWQLSLVEFTYFGSSKSTPCQVAIGLFRLSERCDQNLFHAIVCTTSSAACVCVNEQMNKSAHWLRCTMKYVWIHVPHYILSSLDDIKCPITARDDGNEILYDRDSRSCDESSSGDDTRLPVLLNCDKGTHCWILFDCTTALCRHLEPLFTWIGASRIKKNHVRLATSTWLSTFSEFHRLSPTHYLALLALIEFFLIWNGCQSSLRVVRMALCIVYL